MPPIRINKHLTSDTLHLPELAPLIGHDVEITVEDHLPPPKGPHRFEDLLGPATDPELWDGFDEYLEHSRSEPYEGRLE